MAVLAFLWAMSASSALADTASLLLALGGSMLATFTVVVVATRTGFSAPPNTPMTGRQKGAFASVGLSLLVVGVAAGGALVVLDRPELIPGSVCVVVGLHVLLLTAVFRRALYLWTGVLLCATGAAGIAATLMGDAELARIGVGFTAAVVLWLAALLASFASRRETGSDS